MKVRGKAALEAKVRLDGHDVAAFLNPVMKGLVFISPARKRMALESVRKLLVEVADESQSPTESSSEMSETEQVIQYKNMQ